MFCWKGDGYIYWNDEYISKSRTLTKKDETFFVEIIITVTKPWEPMQSNRIYSNLSIESILSIALLQITYYTASNLELDPIIANENRQCNKKNQETIK